jgi:hypothetical protein
VQILIYCWNKLNLGTNMSVKVGWSELRSHYGERIHGGGYKTDWREGLVIFIILNVLVIIWFISLMRTI